MRILHTALVVLLAACSGGDKDTDTDPGATPGTGERDCAGTAPVIEDVTIEDAGIISFENGDYPGITFVIELSDDDADLDYYEIKIYWDEDIDGSVDTSEEQASGGGIPDGAEECEVDDLTVGLTLAVNGNPPYETDLEFAVVAYDYNGDESNTWIVEYMTPDEDGNYTTDTEDTEPVDTEDTDAGETDA